MPFIKRTGKPTLHYRIDDFTDPWKNAGTILLQHGYGCPLAGPCQGSKQCRLAK
jgi:hypothetical protein